MINDLYARQNDEQMEVMAIESRQGILPRQIFLDGKLLPGMQLKASNTRQSWIAPPHEKHLKQLFDIRLQFVDNASALTFHLKYSGINSEYGPEIEQHQVWHSGADGFKLYRGDSTYDQYISPLGLQILCYLFVGDNYFSKICVDCNSAYIPQTFQHLVTAAIRQIQLAAPGIPGPPGRYGFGNN